MSIQLGQSGTIVGAWQAVMRLRYGSYAVAADGGPLKVDRYYGYDDADVQREYQRRTNQPVNGIVSDGDLHRLGVKPTLFSIHGTGQPDPFGIGYPADIARRLLDVYHWQPVGNYPAQAFPMNTSVDQGEAELHRLITDPVICPSYHAFVDYSQGSIVGGRIRNRMRDGDLSHLYGGFLGSASFGNPMRPRGSYAGTQDPGGHGIDPTLETASEPGVLNLAERGDLYTTCPDGDVGEMERAIFNIVFSRWTGPDSIVEQLWELATDPAKELPALVQAVINGGMFFFQGTAPHVEYHIRQCQGTGRTYYEYAVDHLRGLADDHMESLIARI